MLARKRIFNMKTVLFVIALVLVSVPAYAQEPQVKNPSAVEFTPSTDHAVVTAYEMDILRPDGSVLQTINLGKTEPVDGVVKAALNVQPVAFGKDYSVRVRALAGTAASDYVLSTNKFERAPGAPSKLNIK
jgi:hypothetical protein